MRTTEDWGRIAVSLPGWRWMAGMQAVEPNHAPSVLDRCTWVLNHDGDPKPIMESGGPCNHPVWGWPRGGWVPNPDDPATAGCLLAMLGDVVAAAAHATAAGEAAYVQWHHEDGRVITTEAPTLGRACIAAAEALGRWPGGDE